MNETDFFTEQNDGENDSKDDAELINRGDFGHGTVLKREEIKQP